METSIGGVAAVAGAAMAGAVELFKALLHKRRKSSEPENIPGAVAWMKAAVLRIEGLVSDVPGLKDAVAAHDGKIRRLETGHLEMRADIADVRREADELRDEVRRRAPQRGRGAGA